MISCPTVEKSVIRNHYDLTTVFYRLLWGQHIHHGLWEASETPRAAQLNLTNTLASRAQIQPGSKVLDVGCGMGGSSIHLARSLKCHVSGVTISPLQRRWAQTAAFFGGVRDRVAFQCQDAEKVEFAPASFDRIWSIECTEHLFDKPAFFRRAAEWLRPGGRVAICAWLAADKLDDPMARQVYDVCEGFFCPSLGSGNDYVAWFEQAGLTVEVREDWSDRVARTWEICLQRVRWTAMPLLARLFGANTSMFVDRFQTILDAYRTGAMRYGCFVARKPI